MTRCLSFLFLCLALFAGTALAQGMQRTAPKDVVLGRMSVRQPPEISIDDKADRLSPGARIRDLNNMLVLSGSLAGRTVPVVYRRDAAGLVGEVWLLSDQEYAKLGGARSGAGGAQQFVEMLAVVFGARR